MLQRQHVRVDKRTLRQSQMQTRQPVPAPKMHLTFQLRAHKKTGTTLTLQAVNSRTTHHQGTPLHITTTPALQFTFTVFNNSAKPSPTALSTRSSLTSHSSVQQMSWVHIVSVQLPQQLSL